jgi:hypothetical protein
MCYAVEFHVNVKRFDLTEIPREEKALGEWLRQRWRVKDALLEEFYTKTGKLGDSYFPKFI